MTSNARCKVSLLVNDSAGYEQCGGGHLEKGCLFPTIYNCLSEGQFILIFKRKINVNVLRFLILWE